MRLTDLVWDGARATLRRVTQSALTIVALAIGTAAIVTILGTSYSASAQIDQELSSLDDDAAIATIERGAWERSDHQIEMSQRGNGLVAAIGTFTILNSDVPALTSARGDIEVQVPIVVATKSGILARGGVIKEGALPETALADELTSSLVLGTTAAQSIGVDLRAGRGTVAVGGQRFEVVATVNDNSRQSLLSTAVVLTPFQAASLGILPPTQDFAVAVLPRTAEYASEYLPLALMPQAPESVSVSLPPSARQLQAGISSSTQALVVLVGIATLVMSTFGIATTMQIAVRERRPEIGIYLAMGLRRGQIAMKFLVESLCLGAIGSVLGWTLGILLSSIVVEASGWYTHFPPVIWLVPAIGLIVGAIGGMVPAIHASRLDPAALIRAQG